MSDCIREAGALALDVGRTHERFAQVNEVVDNAQDDKRQKAIAAVKDAWKVLVSVAPEDPGEIIDVAHVRVVDGEGERVDAALAVVRKGRVSRVATQGMGESFEAACDMLAQILLLRASLLRAARSETQHRE